MRNNNFRANQGSPNPFFKPKGQGPTSSKEQDLTQSMFPFGIPYPSPFSSYQEPAPFLQLPSYPPGFAPRPMNLAHSYVPWQYYTTVFSAPEALDKGTLFPELLMTQGSYGPCEGPQPCGGVFYGC